MKPHTVLCVDDEQSILNALKRLTRNENFNLLTANSAREALEILSQNTVHLVISDQRMPEMNGSDFLAIVKKHHPQIVRTILSGYADAASMLDAINKAEVHRFFIKPWNDDELKKLIRLCLERFEMYHLLFEGKL